MYRSIVKRRAMTGSRLGRYKESGQPPGSGGVGPGPSGTAHFSKRFVTCPVRCLMYLSIVKRLR
ncbi:MAG: hypothetical protein Q7T80_01290 [Methanoregula sp.]|nr:hypothetical protein [Methanoregula sp.]